MTWFRPWVFHTNPRDMEMRMETCTKRPPTRREFLKLSSVAMLASGLSGCCDISPSAATPLFAGYQSFSANSKAPMAMNVFYPTKDNSPQNAPFYTGCGKYPLIIFIHGDGTTYQSWFDLPSTLARAGFVVVVPDTNPNLPDQVLADCFKVISFMEQLSGFSKNLLGTFGVAGHSYGGAAALQVAVSLGARAFAGLSGAYSGWNGFPAGPVFSQLKAPALIVWGDQEKLDSPEFDGFNLSIPADARLWNTINRPKHLLTVTGGHHFDYVPPGSPGFAPGSNVRGPCSSTPTITTDFLVSFFSKYMGTAAVDPTQAIPDNLIPPPFPLTKHEAFYDGSFLTAFNNFDFHQHRQKSNPCWFTLHWETNNPTGEIGLTG